MRAFITLNVDELRISQGGFITARTENTGRAGNIEIIASKSVELSDPADLYGFNAARIS